MQLQENPLFTAPKVQIADNRALEAEIAASLDLLQQAEHQNKLLRDELKKKKIKEQIQETRQAIDAENKKHTSVKKKDFTSKKLVAKLTGPDRPRAVPKRPGSTGEELVNREQHDAQSAQEEDEEEVES